MIKANRPISNLDPMHTAPKPLKGGAGFNQNYRTKVDDFGSTLDQQQGSTVDVHNLAASPTTKTQAAMDNYKDSMSSGEYQDALRRAMQAEPTQAEPW